MAGFLFGLCSQCCPACPQGPWCVTIEWDLQFDDLNDGLPPVGIQGSATVWVDVDPSLPDYALRKCLDGAAVNDEPFTDAGCTGTTVQDFCDGTYVNYGGIIAEDSCLDFTWEFNDGGLLGAVHVLNTTGGTLLEGINEIDESYQGGNVTLTGTVTFAVTPQTDEVDCECP